MNRIQAAWLGSWNPPWDLGRGRRWGDPAWALAAIAEAWMLGGHAGRWVRATWEAKKTRGPWIPSPELEYETLPDFDWVSLLRHGTMGVPARKRGSREDEVLHWCWESLLEGNATPWMAYGTVLLDRATRTKWIPLLGAVEDNLHLVLPPFMEGLVPASMRSLPEGWWAFLLGFMDSQGLLLPVGTPPEALPRLVAAPEVRELLEPLCLNEEQVGRLGEAFLPWLHRIPEGGVLDPRLRAWVRGLGASPKALARLVPASLALGDAPGPLVAELLAGRVPAPENLPLHWGESLQADLEDRPRPDAPPPIGEPTLDRLRARWCPEYPEPTHGYPSWGECAHPCADPFHWMAEGQRAFRVDDLELAMRAFGWAYAHFMRMNSGVWAKRAAANAGTSAIFWGGVLAGKNWRAMAGPQPSPFHEIEAARLYAIQDEWEDALPRVIALIKSFPEIEEPWGILAQRGMTLGRQDWVIEALDHLKNHDLKWLAHAFLNDFKTYPTNDQHPEIRLQWHLFRVLRRLDDPGGFWEAWRQCSNAPLRLGTALDLLEARPEERSLQRLLDLQVLADRTGAPRLQGRVRALWPARASQGPADPLKIVQGFLQSLGRPAWVYWGALGQSRSLGVGDPPPPGALSRLQEADELPPIQAGDWIWRGFPLHWEGSVVARALIAFHPEEIVTPCEELTVVAPWLVALTPRERALEAPYEGELLTDGSEPMGAVLKDLARVAPSSLPVLVLGPTGSGKELLAREIHRLSGRSGPLVPVNVTAFGEGLLESELFGHVKGAFTGADRDRKGAVEAAEGGTLFLDEVADLSPRLQSMLLRVLQDRMVRRVGSDRAREVDVRFVAATHKPLEEMAARGAFRQDLLFRLKGTVLELPSLQSRHHEFPYLIPRLVVQVAREARIPCPDISPGLPQTLARLPWHGNFRELRHAIQRALLRCDGDALQASHFPELEQPQIAGCSWEEGTRDFQRRLLLETLRQHRFQVADASRALGLSRPALYHAARRLKVDLAAERLTQEY